MQSIRVSKNKVLDILHTNRAKHISDYQIAFSKFREEVIAEMEKNLAIARDPASREIPLYINIQPPQTFEGSYNTAIEMLDMSEDPEVVLSQRDFLAYIKDEWEWRQSYLLSNTKFMR